MIAAARIEQLFVAVIFGAGDQLFADQRGDPRVHGRLAERRGVVLG